jgi:WD40 repeat protein
VETTNIIALCDDFEIAATWLTKQSRNNREPIDSHSSGGTSDALTLLHSALKLSTHVLLTGSTELPSQLLGRLPMDGPPMILGLRNQIEEYSRGIWLRPLTTSLTLPGGPLVRMLTGHQWGVNCVAVTLDLKYIVSGSDDHTIRVWEFGSGRELHTLIGHKQSVHDVAITPNGKYIASASRDGTIKLWDLSTGQELKTFKRRKGAPGPLTITPDGRWLISGGFDHTARIWDLDTGYQLRCLKHHHPVICTVDVTADGGIFSYRNG